MFVGPIPELDEYMSGGARYSRATGSPMIITREAFEALVSRAGALEAENKELRQLWIDGESAIVNLESRVADLEAKFSGKLT